MQLSIPQLPIEQRGTGYTNDNLMYHNFYQSPRYGSLNLKHENYNERHIFMNSLLQEIYTKHSLLLSDNKQISSDSFADYHFPILFQIETLVYWMRKNMDEIIGLNYYASFYKRKGREPAKLIISSVGTLINSPNSDVYAVFKDHIFIMERLNDISNTYKHSFLTSEAHSLFGKEEPVVNCLDLTNNHGDKGPIFHSYFLREIVDNYWNFFMTSRDALKGFHWNAQQSPLNNEDHNPS